MLLSTLRETYTLNRLSSFQNLRRKDGKFDHRPPAAKGPATPLVSCRKYIGRVSRRRWRRWRRCAYEHLADADPQVGLVELVGNVPAERTELAALLHERVEEAQPEQHLLPALLLLRARDDRASAGLRSALSIIIIIIIIIATAVFMVLSS